MGLSEVVEDPGGLVLSGGGGNRWGRIIGAVGWGGI